MDVVFRTDASLQIGTGHVMRCLSLADALRVQGNQCRFICRAQRGHLAEVIRSRGYAVSLLPFEAGTQGWELTNNRPMPYAHWLGASWQDDSKQTLAALTETGPCHWLVVDHYTLDDRWEIALRPACRRLMVIDDLADRHHDCDILVDQNPGRQEAHYADLVPAGCEILIGPRYALLRPEFARLRSESLARRASSELHRVLISLGGVDSDNVTGKVLHALREEDLPNGCRLTVVLGPHAPWLASVYRQATTLPWRTEVLVNVQDMARLMADSDLSIGAAGGTTWERCCLGLPTVMIVLADNQRAAAASLRERVVMLGSPRDIAGGLSKGIRVARDHLVYLSTSASELVDGLGVERVKEAMETHAVCRTH